MIQRWVVIAVDAQSIRKDLVLWRKDVSEYQYYEFQAIDRPLTQEEQQLSRGFPAAWNHTRGGRCSPTALAVIFPAGQNLLADYYDAMLYLANWGSPQLMFRFPKALLDLERMQGYNVVTHESFRCDRCLHSG